MPARLPLRYPRCRPAAAHASAAHARRAPPSALPGFDGERLGAAWPCAPRRSGLSGSRTGPSWQFRDQARQLIHARAEEIVQRLKSNGGRALNPELRDRGLHAAFDEFLESLLRVPHLDDPKAGLRGMGYVLIDPVLGARFDTHLVQ